MLIVLIIIADDNIIFFFKKFIMDDKRVCGENPRGRAGTGRRDGRGEEWGWGAQERRETKS
jgi:hypothetical protein